MKKIHIYLLAGVLFAGSLSSCGKTTKGKMSNKWQISEMEISSNDDNIQKNKLKGNGEGYKMTMQGDYDNNIINGTIHIRDLTINRDGTYTQTLDYTSKITVDGELLTSSFFLEIEGLWTFLSGNKSTDLKKNERVFFSPTEITFEMEDYDGEINIGTYSDMDIISSYNLDGIGLYFPEGFGSNNWIVKESTNKKLTLISDRGRTFKSHFTSTNGTNTNDYEYSSEEKVNLEITFEKK